MMVHVKCNQVQSEADWDRTGNPNWWLKNVGEGNVAKLGMPGVLAVDIETELSPGVYVLGVGPVDSGVRYRFVVPEQQAAAFEQLTMLEGAMAGELAFVIEDPASEDACALAHEVVFAIRDRQGDDLRSFRREFAILAERFALTRFPSPPPTEPVHDVPEHADTLPPMVEVCECGDMFCVGCDAKPTARPVKACNCGDPRCDVGES